MKSIALFFLLLLPSSLLAKTDDIDALINKLNEAIDNIEVYIEKKDQKLAVLRGLYEHSQDEEQRYNYALLLANENHAYNNDSAVYYFSRCIEIADRSDKAELKNESAIQMGHQYAVAGYYDDAQYYFNKVDTAALDAKLFIKYIEGEQHLYGELSYYSKDQTLKSHYQAIANDLAEQLKAIAPMESPLFYKRMYFQEFGNDNMKEAQRYNDLWMKSLKESDPEYTTMAFFRSDMYKKLGNSKEQKRWLLISAIKDIENATMDQASLWSLASLLNKEGETKLSYKYIKVSWDCLTRFSTHMRGWQVMPILRNINQNYKEIQDKEREFVFLGLFSVSILSVLFLVLFFKSRKRGRLLAEARAELNELNEKLSLMNTELQTSNQMLEDTNRVKERYLGVFINLCSQYIEKIDNFRVRVNRKLRAGQIQDIIAETGSDKLKEKELQELHLQFDSTFLTLFPTFVDDFNKLLRADSQIVTEGRGRLNTPLRIFALIRLGIDDSASIAAFLHYSPNSIYCYRARIKNKALGNRDQFEQKVKSIGII